ncbi:MAG: peptide-methionine (S)-S-oxide reductase MsrA [Cyanobacteriota bacterium]|jgi:peptide-methionine (S)-S-oxide reductase|nr:peptide-methionine (S)-S-oxide reductase MsrA [Cyanobacteriota bacterium]
MSALPGLLAVLLALLLGAATPSFAAAPAAAAAAPAAAVTAEAVLAGGCFWCLEHDLEVLPGVLAAESGYSGGRLERPSYRQVSAGGTGHQESVRVRFDPRRISYATLLRAYWRNIDPLDGGGQFCDRGDSYRPVIFTSGATQAEQARASRAAAARELGRPAAELKVRIQPLERFWPAEAYHQNYAEGNTVKYRYYRWSCGRDRRLDAVWGPRARSGAPWR